MSKKNLNNPTAKGSVGRQAAKSLFSEDGPYDLQEFHDVFIQSEDITEYDPALKLVGSWAEWERIKRDWPAFNTHIQLWKEELEVLFKSRAVKQVLKSADDGNFQASRWIAEQGFNKKAGAGRPSKAEKDRAAKELAEAAAETKDEKARILKLVGED